jgi:hypothetical protein
LVVDESGFVFAQLHFGDAVVEFLAFLLYFGELVFGLLFVVDIDFGEALARGNEGPEYIFVILRPAYFAGRKIMDSPAAPMLPARCIGPPLGVLGFAEESAASG